MVGPEIRAFSVPVGADRQALRKGLVLACQEAGLLAEGFIGGRDGSEVQAATDRSWVRQVLDDLTAPG